MPVSIEIRAFFLPREEGIGAAKRLTDKQKKQLIADRADGISIRQLAQKYKVSTRTVQRVIKGDPEVTQLVMRKKVENMNEVLTYMDSKKEKVCELIDMYLETMTDPVKVRAARLNELSTTFGTVIDKFVLADNIRKEQEEKQAKQNNLFEAIKESAANLEDDNDGI